jgi:hypothetical protein
LELSTRKVMRTAQSFSNQQGQLLGQWLTYRWSHENMVNAQRLYQSRAAAVACYLANPWPNSPPTDLPLSMCSETAFAIQFNRVSQGTSSRPCGVDHMHCNSLNIIIGVQLTAGRQAQALKVTCPVAWSGVATLIWPLPDGWNTYPTQPHYTMTNRQDR